VLRGRLCQGRRCRLLLAGFLIAFEAERAIVAGGPCLVPRRSGQSANGPALGLALGEVEALGVSGISRRDFR
jgi:hypothetical protein